ncbi:hypothetical protein [uncultured Streptomyces sp.]|uniref:hypothetical protein n=1 Tax=uncultured Streptomyces sp. TaxID=174707 RepID=UPI00262D5051|nr:hypothetical protein [uncultured Streptomyces sp.]
MNVLIWLAVLAAVCWVCFFLLPLKRINPRLAGRDPALERALAAASRGRWEPVADLFRDTAGDWERRSLYANRLGYRAARKGDAWLVAWQEARPTDPDAALLRAETTIRYAWKLRGARFARHTSAKAFEGFHQVLFGARDDLARAASLAPEDPAPLVAEMWVALGLGYPNRDMRSLSEQVDARAPYHFGAHASALQYWCAKWRGTKGMARTYAEKAAAGAPRGSLLTALPLIAWYEHEDGEVPDAAYRSTEVRRMVDAALADVAEAGDHPRLPEVRHLLAHFLLKQGRYREAVEQFRHVDGYSDALPWRYLPYGRLAYRAARTRAARGAVLQRLRPRG